MLQLTPQSRVFLACEPADFRRGTSLKLLCYDGQGFWLCQKRLSQGRLTWWPSTAQVSHRLSARELQILLWNGNPEEAGMAEDWRRVA
jgi:transposase